MQTVIVEGDVDAVVLLKWLHLLGAPCFRSVFCFKNHRPRSREHFPIASQRRHAHLFGGFGFRSGTLTWLPVRFPGSTSELMSCRRIGGATVRRNFRITRVVTVPVVRQLMPDEVLGLTNSEAYAPWFGLSATIKPGGGWCIPQRSQGQMTMAEERPATTGFDRKRTGASYASQWKRFVAWCEASGRSSLPLITRPGRCGGSRFSSSSEAALHGPAHQC